MSKTTTLAKPTLGGKTKAEAVLAFAEAGAVPEITGAKQAAADKLYKLSGGNPETAKAIIQQSIENRWKGLFELKNNSNGTKKTGHPTFDDVQAAFNRSVNQRQQAGD